MGQINFLPLATFVKSIYYRRVSKDLKFSIFIHKGLINLYLLKETISIEIVVVMVIGFS